MAKTKINLDFHGAPLLTFEELEKLSDFVANNFSDRKVSLIVTPHFEEDDKAEDFCKYMKFRDNWVVPLVPYCEYTKDGCNMCIMRDKQRYNITEEKEDSNGI